MRAAFALLATLGLAGFTTAPRGGTIELNNESDQTITHLYASTCDDEAWGEDLLPMDVLEPGEDADVTMDAGCWDLRAVVNADYAFEHFDVEVGEGEQFEWTISNE